MEINGVILFKEVQHFRLKWLWWLIIVITVASSGAMIASAMSEKEDSKSIWIALIVFFPVMAAIIWLFYITRFEKIVTTQGVFYKWWPFQKSYWMIETSGIDKFELRKAPFLSYGFHFMPGYGRVHNLNPGKGIQFKMKNGKKIFLGTQKPEELQTVLRKIMPLSHRL